MKNNLAGVLDTSVQVGDSSVPTQQAVVVPWNFTQHSLVALDHALGMVDGTQCIRIVHVATPLSGPDNGVLYASAEKHKSREIEQRFWDLIDDERRSAKISFQVVYGWPAREIARFARRHDAGMIVMSARERHGISKLLFGGVAASVVSESDCPVLVLQGPLAQTRVGKPRDLLTASWVRVFGAQTVAVEADGI